jgi:hypothetical protein
VGDQAPGLVPPRPESLDVIGLSHACGAAVDSNEASDSSGKAKGIAYALLLRQHEGIESGSARPYSSNLAVTDCASPIETTHLPSGSDSQPLQTTASEPAEGMATRVTRTGPFSFLAGGDFSPPK